jgi:hypothetical protein
MEPHQEGDIAIGPNGERAVFRGGQWVMEAAPQAQSPIPGFVPFQSPADRRADQRLDLAEETAARQARSEERRVDMDARTQDRQGVQSEMDLRKEFQSLEDVREFRTVAASYRNVLATANNESAAGDLSLIFAYMKMLDPNSVVREQEFANAQNAAGVPDQIINLYNRALRGERLNPRQRADFATQARTIYENRAARYQEVADWYTDIAVQNGFEPSRIIQAPPEIEAVAQAVSTGQQDGDQATGPLPTAPDGSLIWDQLSEEQKMAIQPGQRVTMPTGEVVTARGGAYADPNAAQGGRQAGPGVFVREPNMADDIEAFSTGYIEQIPFLDEGVTAARAARDGTSYTEARDQYRMAQESLNQTNRGARVAGGLTGFGATLAVPVGGAGRVLANAPKGAAFTRGMMVGGGSGAVYGAASADGGVGERIAGARDGAIVGGLTGGLMTSGARKIGEMANRTAQPGSRASMVNTLLDHGVSLTPGQRIGGPVQTVENLAQRAPILGPAIRGARERGVESLNRAVGNRALDAINEGVPANVQPGGEMVGYVGDRLGQEFDRAYSLIPDFQPDEGLMQGLARIGQGKADLPPAMQQQFDNIISERLQRLGQNATGQGVGRVRSELNGLAAGYLKAPDPAQQALGRMLSEVGDEMDAAVERASPEAGQILARARDGYTDYIRMERASTAAGGRTFNPGQLETAVRASDGSVRRGAVGRGEARMQDLSSAARTVMPDQFGNPGTADGFGLGALAVGGLAEPVTTSAVAAGLGAASIPYMNMGREIVERLPANASRQQVEEAVAAIEEIARRDPKVIVLRDEILRRTANASGLAGGFAAANQPRLMTGAN